MHSLSLLVCAVSFFSALVSAAPHNTRGRLGKRSFDVPLNIRNENFKRDGPAALAKVFAKYHLHDKIRKRNKLGLPEEMANTMMTTDVMPNLTVAASIQGDGVTQAVPANMGAEFLSAVMIGGQMMSMDFDTGSSDLWVFSSEQPRQQTTQHTVYSPTKSSSFNKMQGATWRISYGDGSGAQGVVGMDDVAIGGATVTRQAVEVATSVAPSFSKDTANGGLVGLAFSNLNTVKPTQQKTFLDNAKDDLDMPVLSADLRSDDTGSYQFGKIDNSKFQGELTNVPVDASTGFWQIPSKKFAVGSKVTNNPSASPAIADTGTSLMLVDSNVASAYYRQVRGSSNNQQVGGFTYPCDAKLPNFSVAMGDYMATVPGDQISFAKVSANTCFGGVQSNMGAGIQILGDTMFKTQYVVFNAGNKSLGIAPKTGQPTQKFK